MFYIGKTIGNWAFLNIAKRPAVLNLPKWILLTYEAIAFEDMVYNQSNYIHGKYILQQINKGNNLRICWLIEWSFILVSRLELLLIDAGAIHCWIEDKRASWLIPASLRKYWVPYSSNSILHQQEKSIPSSWSASPLTEINRSSHRTVELSSFHLLR